MSNDRYQKIRDALAGVAERESLRQRAAAWDAVADTLGEVCPEWINHPGTGTEAAVAAIRKLAHQPEARVGWEVSYAECCDTPAYCSSVRRCTAEDTPPPSAVPEIGQEWVPCRKRPVVVHVREQRPGEQHISTREGITPVKPDDLIMRGVAGEEYPISRDLFAQTYDLLAAAPEPGEG